MGNIQNVSILLVPGQRYSLHIQQICGLLRFKGTHTETFYTCVLFHIWLFLPNKTWSSEHFVIERELIRSFSWLHNILLCDIVYPSFFFFLIFCLFKAAPKAHGSSQARGSIGATAAGHSNARSEPCLTYATATATKDPTHIFNLHHSSQQCWMLNPVSKTRD